MSGRTATVIFGGTPIRYVVSRSGRRCSLGLMVGTDGRVRVSAPVGLGTERIAAAVRSKSPWIAAQWRRQAALLPPRPPRHFLTGESIPYLGRTYRVVVLKSKGVRPALSVRAATFVFENSGNPSQSCRRAQCRRLIVRWMREKSRDHGARVCGAFCRALGVPPVEVEARELGKRWGSCTSRGRILLHWRSVMLPMALFEYICAHEVCHLVHPDHSRAFWRTLDRVLPRWRERAARLEACGYRFAL